MWNCYAIFQEISITLTLWNYVYVIWQREIVCFICVKIVSYALTDCLKQIFDENDFDDDDIVTCKQWVSTNRALISTQTTVYDFIQIAAEMIYEPYHHHFIKDSHASYLHGSKDSPDEKTCTVLMDFAKNYSFVIQDAIQDFYWQNNRAILHPLLCIIGN